VFLLPALVRGGPSGEPLHLAFLTWGTLTSLFWGPILLVFLYGDSWLHRLLGHRACLVMATLGYGVYLVHIPIGVLVSAGARSIASGMEPHARWVLTLLGTFASSLAVSYVLHVTIDTAMLKLRDRVAR
jgi:peptidoglycan/LPS O-acetylase OafA/YrhL